MDRNSSEWVNENYNGIHKDAEMARMLQRFPMLREAKEKGKEDNFFESSTDENQKYKRINLVPI